MLSALEAAFQVIGMGAVLFAAVFIVAACMAGRSGALLDHEFEGDAEVIEFRRREHRATVTSLYPTRRRMVAGTPRNRPGNAPHVPGPTTGEHTSHGNDAA